MEATYTLAEIRQQGIGKNFTVLDPQDGFRKDNTIWFGTCDTCGDRVSNSLHDRIWIHTVQVQDDEFSSMYHHFDYDTCPKA